MVSKATKIFVLLTFFTCVFGTRVFDLDSTAESHESERSFGNRIAKATVPREYVCRVGSNQEHYLEYTSDPTGSDQSCNFTLVDLVNRVFLDFSGRIIEFFDRGVPAKGTFGRNITVQGARTISLLPALGIASSAVEFSYYVAARGNLNQGQECSVGAEELREETPLQRRQAKDVLTLERSYSASENLDISFSTSISKLISNDGKREFYGNQILNFAQFEQKNIGSGDVNGLLDPFNINLVQYAPTGGSIAYLIGTCGEGTAYNADDFYAEFPDGIVTLPASGNKRNVEAVQVYPSLGDIPWTEISNQN